MGGWRSVLVVMLLLVFGGCALFSESEEKTKNWSASQLYEAGKTSLGRADYAQAIKYFETLEARYPFGPHAQQAELKIAYAYYKSEEPDSAIAAADRFIKTYPRHPNVDYAYYLKGLVNFNRGLGFLERFIPSDSSQRDPGAARQAFFDFAELVKQFPRSRYAEDATLRMVYLRNRLAQHEVHVADYYMRRKAYLAAANRANYVVENYPRTPAVPDALAIMVEAYKKLELTELSQDALRVLQTNYPDHPYLAEAAK
jgi:outer membrane assembly lipoprotein YfiO